MECTVLFTEDHPDVLIPALEYAGFGSVPYTQGLNTWDKKPSFLQTKLKTATENKIDYLFTFWHRK